jgi:uncharacterized protein
MEWEALMGSDENRATLVKTYEAFGAGDIETILGLQAADTLWEVHSSKESPLNGAHKGIDAVAAFFGLVGTNMDFAKFEMTPIAAEGDVVVAVGEQDYTVKATGKRVAGPLVHVCTFDSEGKLAHFEEWESNVGDAFA